MQVQVGMLPTWRTYIVGIAPNPLLKEGFEAANWDDTGVKRIGSGLQVPSKCLEL